MSSIPLSRQAASGRLRSAAAYLDGLNAQQRAAVEATEGALLVLAGAGTGKTRVLTTRLAHILATDRARPWQILAVTFTNKAAREIKERVGALIGEQVESLPWLGTFHSIAARILRRHAELVGLRPSFTILNTDDQLRLIKQILESENIDIKRWAPRLLVNMIDKWKNRALNPERIPEKDKCIFADGKAEKLYKIYQNRLITLNCCDFGDLLLHNINIFQKNTDVLVDFHSRFRYLLVDEYQDTNVAQYLWLRLLARGSGNVCCVGDDDQSIYGWRGAEVNNILRFEQSFPDATVIRLERNYRSTRHILGAAAGLIAANKMRLGKTLWTGDNLGEKVQISGLWDGEAEARFVSDEIENHIRADGNHADVAVLVRASRQMRAFEDRFITLGLPYKVIGGPRFFERAEIRDALAYLRLVLSLDDDLAFERIVNVPKRGVGSASIQKITQVARDARVPMAEAARLITRTDEIKGKTRIGLVGLLCDLERWAKQAKTMRHDELAGIVLDESGYTGMWRENEDKNPQAASRLDNLKELIRSMGEFDSLEAFLEHISLISDADRTENGDEISIMTLHAAKGLEFPLVFLPGWEEALFPSQHSIDEEDAASLEEERRLAYVGLTRARKKAIISFAANRMTFGHWQSVIPSRFIDELPQEHCKTKSETGYFNNERNSFEGAQETIDPFRSSYESPSRACFQAGRVASRRVNSGIIEDKAQVIESSSVNRDRKWNLGDRVFHQKFGYGAVEAAEDTKLTVVFDKAGTKKVMSNFVKHIPKELRADI